MNEKAPKFRLGTAQERAVIAIASPLLSILCVGGIISIHSWFDISSAAGWRSRLFDYVFLAMFSEMFVAFLALLSLAFIWALFRPAWTVRILIYARDHVWHALLFFLAGFGAIFLVLSTRV